MLSVRIIHAAVRNHGDAVCLGDVTNFDCGGNAATPQNVGLENVNESSSCCSSEDCRQIPMLSCGEGLPRNALPRRLIADKVIGGDIVLNPFQAVGFHSFGDADGVFHVKAGPSVQHEFHIRSDCLARACNQGFKFSESGEPLLRAPGREKFCGLETEFHIPFLIEAGGVAENLLLLRSAEEFINRSAEQFALEIPECAIDCTDGVTGESGGPEGG